MNTSKDRIPDHLVGHKNKDVSFGNVGIDDHVWIGPSLEHEVEPSAILDEHGYDPDDPLTSILSAIIKAHPVEGKDDCERLEIALDAITGTRRKRGMDELENDYELLIEIARKFFRSFHENGHKEPNLAPIIREVVALLPKDDPRIRATPDSVLRRLRGKFLADKDILLVRATSEQNWDRMDDRRSIASILHKLRMLGVDSVLSR